ncbi:MAG TPA: GNAT family N-acetyltransferase [Phototrophicaceae bacterium]|nr:GNAT family N-acetyltransferase [Phototrophicaceae bacterium]
MQLKQFDDPAKFYQQAETFLLAREAEHNLIIGLCGTLVQGGVYELPPYLALVEDAGTVIAAALRTPPFNLILSEMADAGPLSLIVEDVYRLYGASLTGVMGAGSLSRAFAERWSEMTGKLHRLNMAERIYKLETVRPVRGVSGEMRRATAADRDLLVRWGLAFNQEALGEADLARVERLTDTTLATDPQVRGRFLWIDNGQPVCLVGYSGPTPNGIRIAPVYTPPELRGRGYASAGTAAVSQWLLDQGRKFVFLYTDLSNPISNHVYQNIGYEAVGDVDEYRFNNQE